jgi:hypothetical protein
MAAVQTMTGIHQEIEDNQVRLLGFDLGDVAERKRIERDAVSFLLQDLPKQVEDLLGIVDHKHMALLSIAAHKSFLPPSGS